MDKIELVAAKRSALGKKSRMLRKAGKVPAVVYGHGVKPEALELDAKVLDRVYRQAGGNKIVALKIGEGRAKNVLIHDVQFEPLRGELAHVDFYVVRMDEEIRTMVPLHFIGESTAVYQQEGTLVKNIDAVEIEALPGDLPEAIEVDISGLDDFEKVVTLRDLPVPAGARMLAEDLDAVVAKVDPPRSEEELAELEEPVNEASEIPENAKEEAPAVVTEENEGDKDRRDKK